MLTELSRLYYYYYYYYYYYCYYYHHNHNYNHQYYYYYYYYYYYFFLGITARGGPWPPSQSASILPYSAPFPTIFQPA
jgi:hypothetical protein